MKIKTGDKLPSSELFYLDENNDVKKFDILNLCKNNKTIILGMPGAFTKTCSALHLPGYIKNYELEVRIEELEAKFSKDFNENTFNELKELKKLQKTN